MRKILTILLMTGALAIGIGSGRQKDRTEVDLQAAIRMETVEGDLKGAIEQYKKIAQSVNRPVAAKALIRLGQCYEKLGDAEARKAYERVVREFADQKEAVEQARAWLAAGGRNRQAETGLTIQQKWVLPSGRHVAPRHVSLDGRYIPFQTSYSLWLHDLTTGEDRRVVERQADEYLDSPELSPDAKQLAYTRRTEKDGVSSYELRVTHLDGSRTRTLIANKGRWLWPKAWSPDGKHLLVLSSHTTQDFSLALVSGADGSVNVLTTGDHLSNGCFSPDGKYIVTYRGTLKGNQFVRAAAGLTLIPVDGGAAVPLFESSSANWNPFWTPDGRSIVFISDRSGTIDLWSIRMSGGRPLGDPELVKSEAGSIDADPIGFTRDGSFYYKTSNNPQSDIYTAELDPATGQVVSKPALVNQRFVGSAGYPVKWSPDGQFLVFARVSRRELGYVVSKVVSLIVRSDRTGEEREIVPVPALAELPGVLEWFPDGRSLLTCTHSTAPLQFRQIDLQTGQSKVFLDLSDRASLYSVYAPVLSRDGKTLFYLQVSSNESIRLMRRNLESGEEKELYRGTPLIISVSLSSDGREMAFLHGSEEPEFLSLMIMPAEGGTPRELLRSKIPVLSCAWINNSRHLLMIRQPKSSAPPELWSVPIDGSEPKPSGLAMPGLYEVSVHPDGRRIAFGSSKEPTEEVWVIKNLLSTPKTSRR